MNQSILNKTRNDKFLFLFGLPPALTKTRDTILKDDLHDDKIELSVYGLSTPAVNVPSVTLGYGGQTYKTSSFSRPDYSPLEVRFFLDNGYQNYYILSKWLNMFNDAKESTSDVLMAHSIPPEEGFPMQNPFTDYTTNISLVALDEYNNKLMTFHYTEAFITSLGNINYSHQEGVEITCTASFAYNQFHTTLENNINECKSKDCGEEIITIG
jgi:hypothetical protein